MKIKELIEKLKEFDQELMVVISGYEGGVNEVDSTEEIDIVLNVHDVSYYGNHQEVDSDYRKAQYPESKYKYEQAVFIT